MHYCLSEHSHCLGHTFFLVCLLSFSFLSFFFVCLSWLWNFLFGSLLAFSSFSVSFTLEQCFIHFHHLHFNCFSFLSFVLVLRLYSVLVLSWLSSRRASQSLMFDQFTSRKSFSWSCFFLEIMGRSGFLLLLANTQHTQNLTSPKKKKKHCFEHSASLEVIGTCVYVKRLVGLRHMAPSEQQQKRKKEKEKAVSVGIRCQKA